MKRHGTGNILEYSSGLRIVSDTLSLINSDYWFPLINVIVDQCTGLVAAFHLLKHH